MRRLLLLLGVVLFLFLTGCEKEEIPDPPIYEINQSNVDLLYGDELPVEDIHVTDQYGNIYACTVNDNDVNYEQLGTYEVICTYKVDQKTYETNFNVTIYDDVIPEVSLIEAYIESTKKWTKQDAVYNLLFSDNYDDALDVEILFNSDDVVVEGTNTVYVTVTDSSGNEASTAFTYEYVVLDQPSFEAEFFNAENDAVMFNYLVSESLNDDKGYAAFDHLDLNLYLDAQKVVTYTFDESEGMSTLYDLIENTEYFAQYVLYYDLGEGLVHETYNYFFETLETMVPTLSVSSTRTEQHVILDYILSDLDETIESLYIEVYENGSLVDTIDQDLNLDQLDLGDLNYGSFYQFIFKASMDMGDGLGVYTETLKTVDLDMPALVVRSFQTEKDAYWSGEDVIVTLEVMKSETDQLNDVKINGKDYVLYENEAGYFQTLIDGDDTFDNETLFQIESIRFNEVEVLDLSLENLSQTVVFAKPLVVESTHFYNDITYVQTGADFMVQIDLKNMAGHQVSEVVINGNVYSGTSVNSYDGFVTVHMVNPNLPSVYEVYVESLIYTDIDQVTHEIDIDQSLTVYVGYTTVIHHIYTTDDFLSITGNGIYILENDLDFSGFSGAYLVNSFGGMLEGNGYKLLNLTLTANPTGDNFVGVFRYLDHAYITNLIIDDITVVSNGLNSSLNFAYIGTLAANMIGYVSHVDVSGHMDVIDTTLDMNMNIGGFAGRGWDDVIVVDVITDVTITADVSDRLDVGGLFGYLTSGKIMGIGTYGTLSASTDDKLNLGGLIGSSYGVKITNSFADTDLIVDNDQASINMIGGLAGSSYMTPISYSYYQGVMTHRGVSSSNYIGGLVGVMTQSDSFEVFATFTCTMEQDQTLLYFGGLTGRMSNATIDKAVVSVELDVQGLTTTEIGAFTSYHSPIIVSTDIYIYHFETSIDGLDTYEAGEVYVDVLSKLFFVQTLKFNQNYFDLDPLYDGYWPELVTNRIENPIVI